MSSKEPRSVHIKLMEQDDALLTFLMKKEGITNQTEAFRRALKCYKEHAEQLALLKELVQIQKEGNNLLKEIYFKA